MALTGLIETQNTLVIVMTKFRTPEVSDKCNNYDSLTVEYIEARQLTKHIAY